MKCNVEQPGNMDYRDREFHKDGESARYKERNLGVGGEGLSQLPGHTSYHFPSFLGRRKSRGRVSSVTMVRDSDSQSMSPMRHSPRTRYHSNRFSFSLSDSLKVDVSSVTRDVMAPAQVREKRVERMTGSEC